MHYLPKFPCVLLLFECMWQRETYPLKLGSVQYLLANWRQISVMFVLHNWNFTLSQPGSLFPPRRGCWRSPSHSLLPRVWLLARVGLCSNHPSGWLISFRTASSGSIPAVTTGNIFKGWIIFLCICQSFFICSSVDGCFGCFRILTIRCLFKILFSVLLDIYTAISGIAGSFRSFIFTFSEKHPYCFV